MATKQISDDRLKAHIETLGNAGDLNSPPGSRPWAIAVRLELQSVLHDAAFNAQQLKAWHNLMKQYAGYKQLVDEHGRAFKSYEELCKAKPPFGLGCEPSDIDKIINELESAQIKAFDEENSLLKEQGNPSKYLEKFSKLVQACPDEQPINAVKIAKVLPTALSNAHIWRQRWLNLGWIEPLSAKKRGYYQITEDGRKVVRQWLEKVPSATLNGRLWVTIPRHHSKKAAEQLIQSLDIDQLKELYSFIGKSLNQESI
jgi:hypothetical protein